MGLLKGTFVVANVLVLLIAAGNLLLGLWLEYEPLEERWQGDGAQTTRRPQYKQEFIYLLPGFVPWILVIEYLLLAVGGLGIIAAILGFITACKETPSALGCYMFVLIVVILAELAVGALGVVHLIYKTQSLTEYDITQTLKSHVSELPIYDLNTGKFTGNGQAINVLQWQERCCGSEGPDDYINSTFTDESGLMYPPSCCQPKQNTTLDPKNILEKDVLYNDCITGKNRVLYKDQGCGKMLYNWYINTMHPGDEDNFLLYTTKLTITFIVVGFASAVLQVIVLIISLSLCGVCSPSDKDSDSGNDKFSGIEETHSTNTGNSNHYRTGTANDAGDGESDKFDY